MLLQLNHLAEKDFIEIVGLHLLQFIFSNSRLLVPSVDGVPKTGIDFSWIKVAGSRYRENKDKVLFRIYYFGAAITDGE